MKNTPIYLDHAAGAPVRPVVRLSLEQSLQAEPGNPSSIHSAGRAAGLRLAQARDALADQLKCKGRELILTSGATEANNLALLGIAEAQREQGRHIISSLTEHPSVSAACERLRNLGFEITYLKPDQFGRIEVQELESALRDDTILASIIWVNNELGTENPIEAIAQILKDHGALLHVDAVQVPHWRDIDTRKLPVDTMSFSATKIGALPGTGMLYVRQGVNLEPQHFGGHQEQNRRPGTENLTGIVAFAAAWEDLARKREQERKHLGQLGGRLRDQLHEISGVQINTHPEHHCDHILNFSVSGVDGESLFVRLDLEQVAVSNGSACSSGSQQPSPVLLALGLDPELARATLRLSWGASTDELEIDSFCLKLKKIIRDLRSSTDR